MNKSPLEDKRPEKDDGGSPYTVADSDRLRKIMREAVRAELRVDRPLYTSVRLKSVKDLAREWKVSVRTVETILAEGELQPIWIRGQRRFHPDAVAGYLKRCANRDGGGTTNG